MRQHSEVRAVCTGVALTLAGWTLPVSGQTVHGRVIDALTRQPVSGAALQLMRGSEQIAVIGSDSAGRFLLRVPGPGSYRVVASRIGYSNAESHALSLNADQSIETLLQIKSEPVRLAPVTLTASRVPYLESRGFYTRMEAGGGDYLTSEVIRRRNSSSLLEVLRSMKGVKVQRMGSRQEVYLTNANCMPQITVDGVTLRWGGKAMTTVQHLDDLVSVGHIDAVEVFRSSSRVPSEFVGPNAACGVILIWTRHQ